MKKLLDRIPSIFKSFYFMAFTGLLVWLAFFDSNDLRSQYQMTMKKRELEQTKAFYEEQIDEVKKDRVALEDGEQLEKIAREKYYMKKENEDIYVVVPNEEDE